MVVNIINNLPGFRHHLVSLSDRIDLKKDLDPSCKVTALGFSSKSDTFRCVHLIRKYIVDNRIDIVHSHLVLSNIIARLATPRGVRLINSLHNLNGEKIFGKGINWQRLAEKWTYRKRHHIIAVSHEVLADYQRSIGIKGGATVLHNFVDDRFFTDTPHARSEGKELKLVAVGSLKPQKNYSFLVQAFRQLPGWIKLDIYGDGPLRGSLQNEIDSLKVNIRLCGTRNDIEKVLPQYDLYVMCSLFEGHPIALLEAMACGMPTFVSAIPVLKEATGGKGLFFTAGDTGDFVQKIIAIGERRIDLDEHARYNHQYAGKLGRKKNYLERLTDLYTGDTGNEQ